MTTGGRAGFAVLGRSPGFAALFGARSLSLLGDGIGTLALVVHVQQTEGTGTAVGLLLLVASLPRLLSPLLGTVADRVDQRRVLAAAELGQGVVVGAAALWLPELPVLLALLLLKATLAGIAEPAGHSAVPRLVPDRQLPAANALLGGVREAGEVLGPLLGGLVVAAGGARAGLAVDAGTFVLSVPLLARLPRLAPEEAGGGPPGGLARSAWAGLRYTLAQPVTRAVTVGFLLAGLAAADDVALPFLARALGGGELAIGVLYAATGAGLLVGYALLLGFPRPGPAVGFVAGAAVAGLGNGLTGLASGIGLAVGFQLLRGAGLAVLETSLQTLLQRTVPRRLLGRVFANVYGAVNLGASAALLAGGPLLDATSPRVVLLASGSLGLAGAGLGAVLLVRSRAGR